jgi:hypothetical protein
MEETSEWIEHIRSSNLFNWNEYDGFEPIPIQTNKYVKWRNTNDYSPRVPSSFLVSKDLYVEDIGQGITEQGCETITLDLKVPKSHIKSNDAVIYPEHITMKGITRHLKNGKLHQDASAISAIYIPAMKVQWRNLDDYKYDADNWRPGPVTMWFDNYREFWFEGNFIKANWDNVIYDWNDIVYPFFSDLSTYGSPNFKICGNRVRELMDGEIKLLSLLRSLHRPLTPIGNNFFGSASDDMRYLNIIQKKKNYGEKPQWTKHIE